MGGNAGFLKLFKDRPANHTRQGDESKHDLVKNHIDGLQNRIIEIDISCHFAQAKFSNPKIFADIFTETSNSTFLEQNCCAIADTIIELLHPLLVQGNLEVSIFADGTPNEDSKPCIPVRRRRSNKSLKKALVKKFNRILY